jgi:predicted protein tyrosine phosphatase
MLNPQEDEIALAQELREHSPVASPNARMIKLADDILGRRGRMVEAVEMIGRGAEAFEGVVFNWNVARALSNSRKIS